MCRHVAGLHLLAGAGSEAERGPPAPRGCGSQWLRFPEVPEMEARSGYHPALLPPQPRTPPLSHAIVKGKEPGRLCQMPRALGTGVILEWS